MFTNRYRISLLFNANKTYDRQIIEGVGEYLQASQCDWDIFIEEDFRTRIEHIRGWLGDGVIADLDDPEIEALLENVNVPIIGIGGSYHRETNYPNMHYIATDNLSLVECALQHLKKKGINRFAFYGLPASNRTRWAQERELAFRQLMENETYHGLIYQGLETAPDNWQYAQNRLADWVETLPSHTGIIAVTDARARHLLQVCEHLNIAIPEKYCIIGIDNEELTQFLSRVPLSSVVQGTKHMGYLAAKLLQEQLANGASDSWKRILVPPQKVIGRRSTDYRSLKDPAVIQAMDFIRNNAMKGIKVEQVLDAVHLSRSNLEKRFKEESGQTLHAMIHNEKMNKACVMLTTTMLPSIEISNSCGYSSLQYFYSAFKKEYGMTPKQYRELHSTIHR
jgi:LacI family transcriptional regulator